MYKDDSGRTIKDKETKDWIKSLAIPPAWTEVQISEDRDADLLATGRDNKGRKQYIYHPDYRERRNQNKFDRILLFAERLEPMRRVTGQHLRKRKMCREKVLACMVRLMDHAYFRPGSPKYTEENKSYGLTTLRSRHLEIDGDELIFSYRGKSGKDQERHVTDHRLAKVVTELDEMPGYRIFKYIGDDGNRHEVESADLNAYIHEVMGEEFSAKDFRTWAGTMIAAEALDELGICQPDEQREMEKKIKTAVVRVSERLGNTPAVARSSYIDPRVIEGFIDGKTVRYFQTEIEQLLENSSNLSSAEVGVLCMLKNRLAK